MDDIEIFQRMGLAIAIGAAVGVERHWREKNEAEEWPPDERSMQLRILRVNNPDLHIKVIEGLRAGTLERRPGAGANFS